MRTREPAQRSFEFVRWGGRRDGAGRPRKPGAKLRHAPRLPLAARFPVHVTLRTLPGAPNLRTGAVYAAVESALRAALARASFRVVHFSVLSNHVHLVAEAAGAAALARGMQGLAVRIARRVNRAVGRTGRLWRDRYHARILRTPREVRLALCYVLQNARRHATTQRRILDPEWIDPRSSGPWFDGWVDGTAGAGASTRPRPVAEARTWLLASGWRRAGLIRVDEIPAAARTSPRSPA